MQPAEHQAKGISPGVQHPQPLAAGAPVLHYAYQPFRGMPGYVPLPSQMLFDGRLSWQNFIEPFLSTAVMCGWTENEMLLRLRNSLRGAAAEFALEQLLPAVLLSYGHLEAAIEARFKERRTFTSFLPELENRKLGSNEKLPEYVADIKSLVRRSYPTAGQATLETIGLRYFLRGITDLQASLAVGMREPQSNKEALQALKTYHSLKDDGGKGARVRSVQPSSPEK